MLSTQPDPPLCYALYKYMPLYLITQWGGGGEENQWEG